MMLPRPSGRTGGPGLGPPRSGRQRVGAWIASVLAGLLLLGILGNYAYQTRWPPRVDDRELARIGPPVTGARPVGGPYTVAGSVVCIDQCLDRGQRYSAHGSLRQLIGEATRHLRQAGYRIGSGPAFGPGCTEYGPPTTADGSYELNCTVEGSNGKFSATVTVQMYRSQPWVPLPAGYGGQDTLTGPLPDITVLPGDGILVDVSY
jgi:hypothetical protein